MNIWIIYNNLTSTLFLSLCQCHSLHCYQSCFENSVCAVRCLCPASHRLGTPALGAPDARAAAVMCLPALDGEIVAEVCGPSCQSFGKSDAWYEREEKWLGWGRKIIW